MASKGILETVQKVGKVEIGNEFSRINIEKLKRKNKQLKNNDENVQVFEAELSLRKSSDVEDELKTPVSNETLNSSQQHMFADHYREAAKKILHFYDDDGDDYGGEIKNSSNKENICDVEIKDDDIYTRKRIDDFNDIWNISEPKYEDFALNDSENGRMTPFKNSTVEEKRDLKSCLNLNRTENNNQINSISPTPKQRCSLNTEYSTDINRQLICSSNITQRKHNVTSTLCNIRSKVIMDELNAALSSEEIKYINNETLFPSTNISPAKTRRQALLDQHFKPLREHLNAVMVVFHMMFAVTFSLLLLLFIALALRNPICLSEEISECFHKGESHISFKRLIQELFNLNNQCSFFKLCNLFYNSLMGLI